MTGALSFLPVKRSMGTSTAVVFPSRSVILKEIGSAATESGKTTASLRVVKVEETTVIVTPGLALLTLAPINP
jgi:hypothetical protein